MSEILFLALSLWAIALADTRAGGPPRSGGRQISFDGGPSRWREAGAALLAVAAMHTRLAGATLVAALLIAFAFRRRAFALGVTLGLAGASLIAWLAYVRYAQAADAALHASPLLAYDLTYGGYAGGGAARFLAAAAELPRPAFLAAHVALGAGLPMRLLREAQMGESALPLALLVIGYVLLTALGTWARFADGRHSRPLGRVETHYVPLALLLAILWPVATWRLLLPLAPWLLALPAIGLARLVRWPGGAAAGAAVLLLLALAGLPHNRSPAPGVFMAGGIPIDGRALDRALGAVRALPAEARVGSAMAPLVYLHTGKQGVGAWVETGVAGTSLARRDLRTFFIGGEDDPAQAFAAMRAALREYPKLRVGYALARKFPPPDVFGAAVAALPGARLLYTSRDYDLYALPWAGAKPEAR